jgi:spore coat protein U-like protein
MKLSIYPHSVRIKNEWSSTSNSPRYLHGMLKDNCTITFTIYSSHTGNWDNCTRTSALSTNGKGSTGEILKKKYIIKS